MQKSFALYCTVIISIMTLSKLHAQEACSRVAVINYQQVLVDTNSSQKGEGLRFHLEKDEIARSYLDIYQKNSKISWQNAILGSASTGLLLSGIFANDESDNKDKLLISGAILMAVNFLFAKTLEYENEENLKKAIEEYNKRNLPRIYFSPDKKPGEDERGYSVGINKNWSF